MYKLQKTSKKTSKQGAVKWVEPKPIRTSGKWSSYATEHCMFYLSWWYMVR